MSKRDACLRMPAREVGLPDPGTASAFPLTEDRFLGGQLVLRQPVSGYRAAIDPICLAAAVTARPGENILDVGAGHGTAALCLARRVPGCTICGVELQPHLVRLANENARLNALADRVAIRCGDIMQVVPADLAGRFDHVMANPPYLDPKRDCLPVDGPERISRAEGCTTLEAWLEFMLQTARHGAHVTLVHRADRLDRILSLLKGRVGGIVIIPLWPKPGVAAKRVILRARKGARTPLSLTAGLTLHHPDGGFSPAAQAVLTGAAMDTALTGL